jgi:hypothetical protein
MLGLVFLSVVEVLPLPSATYPRVSGVERSSLDLGFLLEASCHNALGISLLVCSRALTILARVVLIVCRKGLCFLPRVCYIG